MKSNRILALMAGLLTLVVIAPTFAAGASPRVYAAAIKKGEILVYDILNPNAFQYYDSAFTYKGDVKFETGGNITVVVNGTHEVAGVLDVYLDITVKVKSEAVNWTIMNETNNNAAFAFALGSDPCNMGFIAHVNWTEWNRSLYTSFGSQLTKFERTPTLLTVTLNITSGNQNTTLIYDLTTGVLKFAFTESSFGGRTILQLASSTIPLPSDAIIPGFPVEMLALAIFTGGIFVVMARKHAKLAPRHL